MDRVNHSCLPSTHARLPLKSFRWPDSRIRLGCVDENRSGGKEKWLVMEELRIVLYFANEYPFKEINRRTLFPRSVSIRRENLKEASNSNGIWKTMYVWISERGQKRLWKLMMDRSMNNLHLVVSLLRRIVPFFLFFFFFLSILSMVSLDDTFVPRLIVGLRETSNSIFNNRADSR